MREKGGLFTGSEMGVVENGGGGERGGGDGRGGGGRGRLWDVGGGGEEVVMVGGRTGVGEPELARDRSLHGGRRQE